MKVKIKQNDNKDNQSTLYLAPYENGKYGYYKIDLHIFTKPRTQVEKEHNKETLRKAEVLRIKLEMQLQEDATGLYSNQSNKLSFFDFFEKLLQSKKYTSQSNQELYRSTLSHFKRFRRGINMSIRDIDDKVCLQFKEYLRTAKGIKTDRKLKQNSRSIYFDKFKNVLLEAVKSKIIPSNPAKYVGGIRLEKTHRNFLTAEELKFLKQTPCSRPLLKKAFLFSCLTGLRHSDVIKLRWKDIAYSELEKTWKIDFRQKKTGLVQYHPISDLAYDILGERLSPDELVFCGLEYSAWNNDILRQWVKEAGIEKFITYHCSRHTYATLLLSKDVNLYTVKELMGHENIKTTEVYAKMVNKTKNIGAHSLNGIL